MSNRIFGVPFIFKQNGNHTFFVKLLPLFFIARKEADFTPQGFAEEIIDHFSGELTENVAKEIVIAFKADNLTFFETEDPNLNLTISNDIENFASHVAGIFSIESVVSQ